MSAAASFPTLLTTKEVAERAKLDERTLVNWRIGRQNLPFYKIGSRVFYAADDVAQFLESRKVGASEFEPAA